MKKLIVIFFTGLGFSAFADCNFDPVEDHCINVPINMEDYTNTCATCVFSLVDQGVNYTRVDNIFTFYEPGTFQIKRTGFGCQAKYQNVTIKDEIARGSLPYTETCANGETINLATEGWPIGGDWDGQGVSGDFWSPNGLPTDNWYTITYTYNSDVCGETNIADQIYVFPVPNAQFFSLPNEMCQSEGNINLKNHVVDLSGTWFGSGVTDTLFKPLEASIGDNSIFYTITDKNSCSDTGTAVITVKETPDKPDVRYATPGARCLDPVSLVIDNYDSRFEYSWTDDSNQEIGTEGNLTISTYGWVNFSVEAELDGCKSEIYTSATYIKDTIPMPLINGGQQDICINHSEVLTASNPSNAGYRWYDNDLDFISTDNSITVFQSLTSVENYYLANQWDSCLVGNSTTCFLTLQCESKKAQVRALSAPEQPTLLAPNGLQHGCFGDTVTVNITNVDSLYGYKWITDNDVFVTTGFEFRSALVGTNNYQVFASEGNCNSDTSTFKTFIKEKLFVPEIIPSDSALCFYDTLNLVASGLDKMGSFWYNENQNEFSTNDTVYNTDLTLSKNERVYLTTKWDTCFKQLGIGCVNPLVCESDRDTVILVLPPNSPNLGLMDSIKHGCISDTLLLSIDNIDSTYTYQWLDGSLELEKSGFTYTENKKGYTEHYVYAEKDGCLSDTVSFRTYKQSTLPPPSIYPPLEKMCFYDTLQLIANNALTSGYTWYDEERNVISSDTILSNNNIPVVGYDKIYLTTIWDTCFNETGGDCINQLLCESGSDSVILSIPPIADFETSFPTAIKSGEVIQFQSNSVNAVKHDWTFGDGFYSVDKNPWHYFYKGGNHNIQLIVTDSVGCVDTLLIEGYIFVEETVGIDENELSTIKVFPNPFIEKVVIDFGQLSLGRTRIILMDLSGKIINERNEYMSENTLEITGLSLLPKGIYLLQISNEDSKQITYKINKQ